MKLVGCRLSWLVRVGHVDDNHFSSIIIFVGYSFIFALLNMIN